MVISTRNRWLYVAGALVAIVIATGIIITIRKPFLTAKLTAAEIPTAIDPQEDLTRVEFVRPSTDKIERSSLQPGSAHSYESAELFAKVSGFLKSISVDIGSRVREGDILAEIDVPELVEDEKSAEAAIAQVKAEVAQAVANVESVTADQMAAEAKTVQAKAETERYQAIVDLANKQLVRYRELNDLKAIENRLVDERLYDVNSAKASLRAAETSVMAAELMATAANSRISQAKAQLEVVRAKVTVAESQLSRARVMLSYTKIKSPYDGVITCRNFHRGAYIRSPDQGGQIPLLSVDRTDQMRLVVRIPERQVPFIKPGNLAEIHFDAFPNLDFQAPVARIAATQNPTTRTMLVEIDLPNPKGLIQDQMYGRVSIALDETLQGMTIPSACLVGDVTGGKAKVFLLDGELITSREIRVGRDTGVEVEVLEGLGVQEQVVLHPDGGLMNGSRVLAVESPASASKPK